MPSCIDGYTAVSPGMYRQYHAFEFLTLRSEVKSEERALLLLRLCTSPLY